MISLYAIAVLKVAEGVKKSTKKLYEKYKSFPPINIKNRTWPNKVINKAPMWCSVDLRDGNQALLVPMNLEQKLKMFELLIKIGFSS